MSKKYHFNALFQLMPDKIVKAVEIEQVNHISEKTFLFLFIQTKILFLMKIRSVYWKFKTLFQMMFCLLKGEYVIKSK